MKTKKLLMIGAVICGALFVQSSAWAGNYSTEQGSFNSPSIKTPWPNTVFHLDPMSPSGDMLLRSQGIVQNM